MTKEIAQSKLEAARRLLARKRVIPGLCLIMEVADHCPEAVDPTLLATVPLWRSVVKHLARFQHGAEIDWTDDQKGHAA